MLCVLPLTIHWGHTALKHKFHANSWSSSSGKQILYYKTVYPVFFDCHSLTQFPVTVAFPTNAELKADPVRNPLLLLHLVSPPPSLPAPPQWGAAQAWFLSLARLQSQISSLCSGFPLGLTRGLSTKHRLLIICLKSPLCSTGRYEHPLVVNTVLCVVIMEKMFYKCVYGGK